MEEDDDGVSKGESEGFFVFKRMDGKLERELREQREAPGFESGRAWRGEKNRT